MTVREMCTEIYAPQPVRHGGPDGCWCDELQAFAVCHSTVDDIVSGKQWSWLKQAEAI